MEMEMEMGSLIDSECPRQPARAVFAEFFGDRGRGTLCSFTRLLCRSPRPHAYPGGTCNCLVMEFTHSLTALRSFSFLHVLQCLSDIFLSVLCRDTG